MLPDPIHPAIVHFPVALSILLPVMTVAAFLLARRGPSGRPAWLGVVAGATLLVATSWLAVETGEQQEERVEDVVGDAALHAHQDRATLFLYLAAGTLVLTSLGLARGRAGTAGRVAGTIAVLTLPVAGYLVGHSGGQLVYRYGAAQAYATAAGPDAGSGGGEARSERGGDRDDDRE